MKSYTIVSRKTVEDDRIAICPKFGCENLTRVKPLKLGFLGFGKYPKCREHQIPLVYVDERIGDFVSAALSCLFDISGLPPQNLLFNIKKEIPEEVESFIKKWIYCITTGRGAPIISRYMDSISNSYFKQLSKKQLKFLKNENKSKKTEISLAIKNGIQEIANQYTRLLKHLRIHHEVFNEPKELKPLSNKSKKVLSGWLESSNKENKVLLSIESKQDIPLPETKKYYDSILNMGICMCLLGYSTKKRENTTKQISAFDRFNAYFEFYSNGLTQKFTKSDMEKLLNLDFSETFGRYPKSSKAITIEEFDNINEEGNSIKFYNYLSKKNSKKNSISSVQRGLQQWQSNKAISLSVVENLAKSVKNAYIKDLKNRHRQVILTFGSPFVTLTNQKLANRYLNKAQYNYTGIIYKIRDTVTGRFYYGLTTQSLAKRWYKHIKNYKASSLNPDSLDFFIFKLEEDLINQGYTNSQAYGIINSRFERIPVEVCFDLLTLLQREKFYISNARKINPSMCFNIAPGGGGFRLVDYIPLNDLIVSLAKGYTLNAIVDDLGLSMGAISKFCQKFWGGYYDSLDLFLKPVVEELIKKGYDRKYIAAALGGEENRNKPYKSGHYRFTTETLTRYCCERWWPDCNDWGDVQEKFLKEIFESLVLKGYDYKDMVEELEAFNDKQQIKYRLAKMFKDNISSGLGAARRILLKPLLTSLLLNHTDADIIEKLNLKNWLPFGASNNKITNEKRLLNHLVENIWLHKYITYRKGMNYELRVKSIYNGEQATDIVRYFLKTGFLKFQS